MKVKELVKILNQHPTDFDVQYEDSDDGIIDVDDVFADDEQEAIILLRK